MTTGGQADELQKLRKQLEKKLNDRKQGNNQLLALIEEKTKEFDKKNFDNEETIRKNEAKIEDLETRLRQTTKSLTQTRTRADTGEQKNSELTNEFN